MAVHTWRWPLEYAAAQSAPNSGAHRNSRLSYMLDCVDMVEDIVASAGRLNIEAP
jgi:hypothetical protein